jgi:hypothetical protein
LEYLEYLESKPSQANRDIGMDGTGNGMWDRDNDTYDQPYNQPNLTNDGIRRELNERKKK